MTDARGRVARPGGKILADALVAQGVTHAFCVPGESYLDLLDGLYAVRNRLTLVTCRFEAGAVHMAEAYGKLTGRPGVCFVTRGPGASNASIGATERGIGWRGRRDRTLACASGRVARRLEVARAMVHFDFQGRYVLHDWYA